MDNDSLPESASQQAFLASTEKPATPVPAAAPVEEAAPTTYFRPPSQANAAAVTKQPLDGSSKQPKNSRRNLIIAIVVGVMFLLGLIGGLAWLFFSSQDTAIESKTQGNYIVTSVPLSDLAQAGNLAVGADKKLVVNGQLQLSNTLVLNPTSRPTKPVIGQLYFDGATSRLTYYNGT